MRRLSVYSLAQPLRDAPRLALRVKTRHPARSGLSVKIESASQKPFEGSRTRGSPIAYQAASILYGPSMCSFQGVVRLAGALLVGCLFGQSKRLQSLRLFTNNLGVGPIFHHCLCAVFGTLFLPDTCFGTGTGLIRSGCQCRLLFWRASDAVAAMD